MYHFAWARWLAFVIVGVEHLGSGCECNIGDCYFSAIYLLGDLLTKWQLKLLLPSEMILFTVIWLVEFSCILFQNSINIWSYSYLWTISTHVHYCINTLIISMFLFIQKGSRRTKKNVKAKSLFLQCILQEFNDILSIMILCYKTISNPYKDLMHNFYICFLHVLKKVHIPNDTFRVILSHMNRDSKCVSMKNIGYLGKMNNPSLEIVNFMKETTLNSVKYQDLTKQSISSTISLI